MNVSPAATLDTIPTPCPTCGSQRHMTHHGRRSNGEPQFKAICAPCYRRRRAEYRRLAGGSAAYARQWDRKNPEKYKAHRMIEARLARKTLQKQSCERCGATNVHAHHDDYSKPLEIMWLCPAHHAARHRELKEASA